ncbi:MAG: DUF2917 domain-containing protein [Burkholderiales bacterium]|nr:DUF2917 domain-containing protein [Burkholderiales bacterium]
MNKFSFTATHAANGFGIPADRLSHLFALLVGLGCEPRTGKTADTLSLAKGGLHYVAKPRSQQITCMAGAVWLTFDGEPQDVVLEAGESYRCVSNSRLGISAFEAATVQIA